MGKAARPLVLALLLCAPLAHADPAAIEVRGSQIAGPAQDAAEGDWFARMTNWKRDGAGAFDGWIAAMRAWRAERLAGIPYDGSQYDRPELLWTQRDFVQPQVMVEDRFLYDPVSRRYTVGRLLNDKMPTGVAVSPAMNHGGPFPATGHPGFTAVGFPAALRRFAMLACYDNVRLARLPFGQVQRHRVGRGWCDGRGRDGPHRGPPLAAQRRRRGHACPPGRRGRKRDPGPPRAGPPAPGQVAGRRLVAPWPQNPQWTGSHSWERAPWRPPWWRA